MAKPREPWKIRPTTRSTSIPESIKAELQAKARDLIEIGSRLNPTD
jgi:hypothetical protein